MSFRDQAQTTAAAVHAALGTTPDQQQANEVVAIIERAIVESARQAHDSCAKVVVDCCPEERDLAHKIAGEIRSARKALVANLSSLR